MFFCGSVPSSGIFLKSEDFDHFAFKIFEFSLPYISKKLSDLSYCADEGFVAH
jgi:hypothetical protein